MRRWLFRLDPLFLKAAVIMGVVAHPVTKPDLPGARVLFQLVELVALSVNMNEVSGLGLLLGLDGAVLRHPEMLARLPGKFSIERSIVALTLSGLVSDLAGLFETTGASTELGPRWAPSPGG